MASKSALEWRFWRPFGRQVRPGTAVSHAFGRQVGPGMAVSGALGRQVGSGTTVLGVLGRQVGLGLGGKVGWAGKAGVEGGAERAV